MDPFQNRYSWWIKEEIDIELLNQLSQQLVGEMDFKCFQSTGTEVSSTVRTIHSAIWSRSGEEVSLEISGNGFLKQMVRNIVGSLISFSQKSDNPGQDLAELLESKDRKRAAPPAPARGLFLKEVQYPEEFLNAATPWIS